MKREDMLWRPRWPRRIIGQGQPAAAGHDAHMHQNADMSGADGVSSPGSEIAMSHVHDIVMTLSVLRP